MKPYPHSQAALRVAARNPTCYLFSCWSTAPKNGWHPAQREGTQVRELALLLLVVLVLWAFTVGAIILIFHLS